MVFRLAKLTLGFLLGLAAGYALCAMRPAAVADRPMEDLS